MALLYSLGFGCQFKFFPRVDSPSTKTVDKGKEVVLFLGSVSNETAAYTLCRRVLDAQGLPLPTVMPRYFFLVAGTN